MEYKEFINSLLQELFIGDKFDYEILQAKTYNLKKNGYIIDYKIDLKRLFTDEKHRSDLLNLIKNHHFKYDIASYTGIPKYLIQYNVDYIGREYFDNIGEKVTKKIHEFIKNMEDVDMSEHDEGLEDMINIYFYAEEYNIPHFEIWSTRYFCRYVVEDSLVLDKVNDLLTEYLGEYSEGTYLEEENYCQG